MTGEVTWPALLFVVSLIVGAGTIVAGIVVWLMTKISNMQRDHDAFRIEVAKEYAPLSALFKVEARVAAEMKALREDFNAGFDRVVKVMHAMIPARRSKPADPLDQ